MSSAPAEFRRALLRWYDAHKRELPWRATRDPYAIWLSEVMLQQTTVQTVWPRWERFLRRWPTVEHLAAAPLDDVLHEWSGLGYYARARNLHRAAEIIARDFGGVFPDRFELLLALPGMGPYTAAAVASIAFQEAVPLVDANVERVLTRLYRIETDTRQPATKRRMHEIAGELLSTRRPGDFNQALMELGATVCHPAHPRCVQCPVAKHCTAHRDGVERDYPRKTPKPPIEPVREAAVVIENPRREVLLLLRPKNVSFGGMWELPRVRCLDGEESEAAALRAARDLARIDIPATALRPAARVVHTVMRNRITLTAWRAEEWKGTPRISAQHEDLRWVTRGEWQTLPRSTAQRRVAEILYGEEGATRIDTEESEVEEPDLFAE